jgi:adenosine deaminase
MPGITVSAMTFISAETLLALPKAELHLHLEGAVSAETLLDLARKHGSPIASGDLEAMFRFDDLGSFLQMYGQVCDAMRDPDDFMRTSYEALARVAHSGGRYVELFFSPDAHAANISYPEMLDGIIGGMHAAEVDFGVLSRLIPAHNRERGPERGLAFVEMVLAERRAEVIGIGLDYLENDPRPFETMYARARAGGLHVTAHAGETGPASHVRDSIDVLRCERIDHGYHIIDDPELVRRACANRTYFMCCPTTTMYSTVWRDPSAPDHAIRQMLEAGLAVSINTDDPGLMRTTLLDEYRIVVEQMGATAAQLKEICLNGVRASWLDGATKRTWLQQWTTEIDDHLSQEPTRG